MKYTQLHCVLLLVQTIWWELTVKIMLYIPHLTLSTICVTRSRIFYPLFMGYGLTPCTVTSHKVPSMPWWVSLNQIHHQEKGNLSIKYNSFLYELSMGIIRAYLFIILPGGDLIVKTVYFNPGIGYHGVCCLTYKMMILIILWPITFLIKLIIHWQVQNIIFNSNFKW